MMKKNVNERSYQLSIEYPRDFKIILNKKTTFLVNPLVLSSVSDLFKEKYMKDEIPFFEVSARVNDKSFSDFLYLAHGQKVDLTLKTAVSILKLAKTWKSPIIQNLIERFLTGEPEVEVKIAEIIDDFDMLDLLPTVNTFKDKKKLLINMFQCDSMHSIQPEPLQALLEIAISFNIDRNIINSFLIEHFKRNPNLKPDFLNRLDYSNLSNEQLRALLADKRTKNVEQIQQAANYLAVQKDIPQIGFSKSFKLKPTKISKSSNMKILSHKVDGKGRSLKMQEPYVGIFAKITYESKGEPFKNGFIKISTTSHDPQNFLNPSKNDDFIITTNDNNTIDNQNGDNNQSQHFSYPYVIFQLPVSVSVSSYSIRNSFKAGSKEWILYGSKDQSEWDIIDNQESPDEIIEPRETIKIDLESKSDSYSSFKLVSPKYYPEDEAFELVISSFELFDDDEYSEGVFKKLCSEEKYINVVTSSNNPQVLISPRHKKIWYSTNEPKQSITFHFLKHKVQPTKYTLKSGAYWHLRSWQVSGSYDGKKWFILDKKANAMQMDRKFVANVWKIQQDYHICKYLRITQNGSTYDGMNILCLSGVEFFGNVESDENEGKRLMHDMQTIEELRSARGIRSPRSPRISAPVSPVSPKPSPRTSNAKNKNSVKNVASDDEDEKPQKEKKNSEQKETKNKDKKKTETKETKKVDDKKKETEKKADDKKKEPEKKADDKKKEPEKKADDKKKEPEKKDDDKKKETEKKADDKKKEPEKKDDDKKKETEKKTDDKKKEPEKKDDDKKKETEKKVDDKKNDAEKKEEDKDNKKEDDKKKVDDTKKDGDESNDTVGVIDIDDFTASSESIKDTDTSEQPKTSENTSSSNALITVDISDKDSKSDEKKEKDEDNETKEDKDEEKKNDDKESGNDKDDKKDSSDGFIEFSGSSDFTQSDSDKSSDHKKSSQVEVLSDVEVISDSSDKKDSDKESSDRKDSDKDSSDKKDSDKDSSDKKESDKESSEKSKEEEKEKKEDSSKKTEKASKSESSDITGVFSSDDSKDSKDSKTDKSKDKDDSDKVSTDDVIEIEDISSDSNKDNKTKAKSDDAEVEILDDFSSDF